MLQLDNILNEIDDEWDVPVMLNHHYDMELFNEEATSICLTNDRHLLAVFFTD